MVKYPAGQGPRKTVKNSGRIKRKTNYASRGMTLEDMINQSNEYYLSHHRANIHKKPTPIQVVQVDYPRRSAAKITEAYYRQASTTDYNGVYRGYYIDFEAKETKNKTGFPLSNLPVHQQDHMRSCQEHGGLAFLLISFTHYKEIFLLPFSAFDDYKTKTNKQSIPYSYIQAHGYLCPVAYLPTVDYLSALDTYLKNKSAY